MSNNEAMLKELLQNSRNSNSSLKDLISRVTALENEPPSKKIRLTNSGDSRIIKTKVFTSAQQPDPGPSTSGLNAQPSRDRSREMFPMLGEQINRANSIQDQPDHSPSDSYDDVVHTSASLDQILANSDSDSDVEESPPEFPILDSESLPTWHPSDAVFKWFSRVADIELKDEQISEISEAYLPSAEIETHFQPPLIPKPLWQKCKASRNEHKQMALFKIQQSTTLAIKPLIAVLETLDSNDPRQKQIASAIQLLCSSNLKTSRLRRSFTSNDIRKDLRSNIFSQPVDHLNLFGTDFDTVADNAVKAQSASQKVLFKPAVRKKNTPNQQESIAPPTSPTNSATQRNSSFRPPSNSNYSVSKNNRGNSSAKNRRGNYNRK